MEKLMSVKLFVCDMGRCGPLLLLPLLLLTLLLGCVMSTHIFTLDDDFSKLNADPELSKHVEHVLQRLKTFKVAVHPRIRLFYHLLKLAMVDYAHRTGDSLYMPYVYRQEPTA